jgi:hypothetical protein
MEPAIIISMKIIRYPNQENLNDYLALKKKTMFNKQKPYTDLTRKPIESWREQL